jgi:hypothetical protein
MAKKRVCVVGGGIAGLGAAWALARHPDRFEVELWERQDRLGGNAVTVDMPQDDGSSIPFDISVTACIPSVYHNYLELLRGHGVPIVPTRFSYTVLYDGQIYAHDFDSPLKAELQAEIDRFQQLLRTVGRFNALSRKRSLLLGMLNPFNYVKMRLLLDARGFSSDFRCKILKPMFVNFLLATNIYDLPASIFCRYLDFFDVETATPMTTWDQGTRTLYQRMAESFAGGIRLGRGVRKVRRRGPRVLVEDQAGVGEEFDEVILACNANQALMMLERPGRLERFVLSSIRYESELHNHAIVHSDASVLPDNATAPLDTRTNFIVNYGARPDNYEITYIMHNQQPWAKASDKPCLVTYNPISAIDPAKIVARHWFQHVVHDVFHVTVTMNLIRFLQGAGHVWYAGAHTLMNSQEHCLVSGLAAARQIGADYPFADPDARKWFNFYGRLLHGVGFRNA